MSARMQWLIPGVLVAVVASGAVMATAQNNSRTGPKWNIKVNETKGPVRTADVSTPLGQDVVSEILAGPPNGEDDAYMIFTRMPAGARGRALSPFRMRTTTWSSRAKCR